MLTATTALVAKEPGRNHANPSGAREAAPPTRSAASQVPRRVARASATGQWARSSTANARSLRCRIAPRSESEAAWSGWLMAGTAAARIVVWPRGINSVRESEQRARPRLTGSPGAACRLQVGRDVCNPCAESCTRMNFVPGKDLEESVESRGQKSLVAPTASCISPVSRGMGGGCELVGGGVPRRIRRRSAHGFT